MEERKNRPDDVLTYHLPDNARDLYFLAMTYHKLSLQESHGEEKAAQALRCYEAAEKIYEQRKSKNQFIEYWDIFERIRAKAQEVLNISP
ncbi:MAG: hypothetical protein KJ645_04895 [Planctomycetes bacterium]|nr:hypothetical protein [Planctomycetota bacterium]